MGKKVLAFMCVISMIATFTGCRKEKQQNLNLEDTNTKENYVECEALQPDLKEGEIRFDIELNAENQLEYYTLEFTQNLEDTKINCYTLVDGSYQKSSVEWAETATHDISLFPTEFCHGEDGSDYILGYQMQEATSDQSSELTYKIIKKQEDTKEGYVDITPSKWCDNIESTSNTFVSDLQVTENHILCYRMDCSLCFFNPTKDKLEDFGNFEIGDNYVIKENTLYYIPIRGTEVEIQSLGENKVERIALTSASEHTLLLVSSNHDISLLDADGIHEFKDGGTMWETVVDGKEHSMSAPSYQSSSFIMVPGTYNTYYVVYMDQVNKCEKFISYTYGESDGSLMEPTSEPKELTIYSLWDNTTIREAISEYKKEYPEIKINYVVAMTEENSATQSDLIRALNTEILAGNGADIFLMDGLPLSSYIQKGILMDMSELLSDSAPETTLLSNISDCYNEDGKVYCMPLRVYMPVYNMSKDISSHTKSVEDLATYCKDSDAKLMESLSYKKLVQMFLYTYSDEIFTADGMIDQERLESFLSSISEIANQTGAKEDGSNGTNMGESGIQGANNRMRDVLCGSEMNIMLEDLDTSISFVGDIANLTIVSGVAQLKECQYTPVNNSFVPNGLVAINQATKEPEAAKEFVTFLFSEKVQSLHLNDGYPVNEKALASWMEIPEQDDGTFGVSSCNEEGKEIYLEFKQITVEEKLAAYEMIKTLTKPVYNDFVGMDLILTNAVDYLKGDITVEQASDKICEKMILYLNE